MLTLEVIKQKIKDEQEKYKIPYEKKEGYEECNTYLQNNHITKAEHLLNIDIWECFKCLLFLKNNKEMSMEKCRRIAEISRKAFSSLDYDAYERVIDMLFIITDLDNRDQILEYLKEPNRMAALSKIAGISESGIPLSKLTRGELEDGNLKTYLRELRKVEQSTHTIEQLIEFIEEDSTTASDLYSFVKAQKRMKLEMQEIEDSLKDFAFMIREKDKVKTISQIFSKMFSTEKIVAQQNMIHSFVSEEDKKSQDHQKDNQRMLRVYNKVLDLLDIADTKDEVTAPKELIRGIPKDDIKRSILTWVYEKNNSYYKKLEEELRELSINSINQYLAVLNRYHITLHPKVVSTLTKNTPQELERILQSIPKGMYEIEELLYILQTTTVEIAEKIKKYIDSGYIDTSKVKENYSLYHEEDKKLFHLDEAIELLKEYGINPKSFSGVPELLWESKEQLGKNLELLNSYNLIKNLKTTSNYSFLLAKNLYEIIDLYVELGFYKEIEQDIGLLNVPIERIKRLELLEKLNIPVEDIETLAEILENNKFMIPDDEIDNYILDYASFKDLPELELTEEELENMSQDKITIKIGGITFSLPKIKRNRKEGKTLSKSIFTGKRLTEEEYNNILEALKPHIITKK